MVRCLRGHAYFCQAASTLVWSCRAACQHCKQSSTCKGRDLCNISQKMKLPPSRVRSACLWQQYAPANVLLAQSVTLDIFFLADLSPNRSFAGCVRVQRNLKFPILKSTEGCLTHPILFLPCGRVGVHGSLQRSAQFVSMSSIRDEHVRDELVAKWFHQRW
jgi:hypothetical protein